MLPDLAYTRTGTPGAPPLVLLHGIGHRRQAWDPIIEPLARDYDVFAVDLSGFGESPALAGGLAYTMDQTCEHLTGQFEKWGIAKPHIAGNSLGGAIGLELGARGRVASVTALSPAGFFGPWGKLWAFVMLIVLRVFASTTPKPVLRALTNTPAGRQLIGLSLYSHPERHTAESMFGDTLGLKYATAFYRTLKAAPFYRFASQVRIPVTIAWGTKDRLLPYRQAAVAQTRLPTARHEPLPGAGHVPMADDPELVVRLIGQTAT